MADFADHGSAQEAQFNEMAIADQLARSKNQSHEESEEFCIECGREIPEARRKAVRGCKYCTACQEFMEKHK